MLIITMHERQQRHLMNLIMTIKFKEKTRIGHFYFK